MMGNFSIGDYFKNEAIEFAYELLTSEKWFAIPIEKLYVTIYTGDNEAYNKWIEMGMLEDHIIRLDENFWEIGKGPCGPDSEIFYDRGEKYDKDHDALEKFKKMKNKNVILKYGTMYLVNIIKSQMLKEKTIKSFHIKTSILVQVLNVGA